MEKRPRIYDDEKNEVSVFRVACDKEQHMIQRPWVRISVIYRVQTARD